MTKSRITPLIIILSVILLTFLSCNKDFDTSNIPLDEDRPAVLTNHIINPDSEVRGVWIASVYNIDFPSKNTLSAGEIRGEIDHILDTCEKNAINTVFFQVRPTCDALYKSDIYPTSTYLSKNGTLTFDPLEYIVDAAHKRNIYVHAWVNPLRVTMNSHDVESLPENSPARKNPEWVFPYADGKLYLNAGIPEVRKLVADGIREIVSRYDVDGVVFDDYFYPYPVNVKGKVAEIDDAAEFEKYGEGFDSVEDWRRDNINKLVRAAYDAVHETDPECVFGVSPFAVWQNDNGKNGGSATTNMEAYHSLYCDALAWVDGGYIDYISPQIYWRFSTTAAPFDVVARWWNAKLSGTDVKLYVSHASYKYEDGEWSDPGSELSEQISFARSLKSYRGSIFYGFDELKHNMNGAANNVQHSFEDEIIYTDIQSTGKGVTFTSPKSGSSTASRETYIIGTSDPYYPLTLGGESISQTKSGYFSVFVDLEVGENTFIFEQNGIGYAYTITYAPTSGTQATPQKNNVILNSSAPTNLFPSTQVAIGGDILWVSCTAPYGSYVTAEIGGVVTELSRTSTPSKTYDKNGLVGVTYAANAKLPKTAAGEITDCGNVKFTVSYNGTTASAEGCRVRVLGDGAMLCVTAKDDYTELKITESSSYYNDYTVQSAGMTDFAVSLYGGYYKLKMGGFVSEDDVFETDDTPSDVVVLTSASISSDGDLTTLRLGCKDKPPYNGAIDGDKFILTLYGVDSASAPTPSIGKNPLFSDCEIIKLDDRVRYALRLHDVLNFYGFDLHYEDGEVLVEFINPKSVDISSNLPLSGINIVIDAGHGGDDPGAAGAYLSDSVRFSESDINLMIARETCTLLEKLGASVTMTRTEDTTLALMDRVKFLEEKRPDLVISIHQNSMNYNVDITRVRGTLALWCMDSGHLLSDTVGRSVAASLGRKYMGSNYQMLAMCRNPKFPSALIEVGFMTSVEEYEQMSSGFGIKKAAHGICDGVIEYFRIQNGYIEKYK